MSEPYKFGGIDWITPTPERCAASDRLILESARSSRPFQRIPTAEQHTLLSSSPADLKIGWDSHE